MWLRRSVVDVAVTSRGTEGGGVGGAGGGLVSGYVDSSPNPHYSADENNMKGARSEFSFFKVSFKQASWGGISWEGNSCQRTNFFMVASYVSSRRRAFEPPVWAGNVSMDF